MPSGLLRAALSFASRDDAQRLIWQGPLEL
jgi:hypothetical protein